VETRITEIAVSHIEADGCGVLVEGLAAAPGATVTHGAIGCAIWLNDQAPRPPRWRTADRPSRVMRCLCSIRPRRSTTTCCNSRPRRV